MGVSVFDRESPELTKTRTIAVTSGKGGVGKTTLVSNLAVHLSRLGKRVLILDGDLGMANVDIMFGVKPRYNIQHVLGGDCSLGDALMEVDTGVHLIPGGSGVKELQSLKEIQKRTLIDQVKTLGHRFDFLIIDTAPGIDDNVLYLNAAAQEINVVITPEPSSLTDSYALIKVLNKYYKQNKFSILCNQVRDESEGLVLFRRVSDIADRFLCVSLDYKGSVPADPSLKRSTKTQQLVVKTNPHAPSSLAIGHIARKMNTYQGVESLNGGLQFFWEQLVGVA